ncbi:kinesin-like protein KIN-14P [Diaphorina citri]|uniref:Kinesin-like protein KIN-14P n=1 Tax=Diaphorina citri TaxID=121845 RepID=A0A1S3DS01_DIACI|nr:kinesin-like protein KIN-14P [Diaphorina citri]
MNVNPFEHRNEKMVSDFLNSEASTDTDQTNAQERLLPSSSEELSGSQTVDPQPPMTTPNTPINLLNDTYRRNLLSLSTSKSTSIEDYTDKSTRGTSTVSKSVSLESSAGGGGGGGGVYFDDLMMKPSDSTNSSTVFSSCDNIRKLLSSAAESSSEPACTNSHCEEACMLEMEKRNEELSALLSGEQNKSDQLEVQVAQLKSEVHALHGALAEKDKYYASAGQDLQQQIKSQTHTIQILIEEKNQLEARLNASGDAVEAKNREMDELKGRLAISKHKSANMERDMMVLQEQMKQEKKLLQETTAALSQERKQLEDLAEDKVELTHKLDTKSKELQQVQILLQERDSQLSLMHLKVQQLSAAGGMQSSDVTSDVLSLQQERDQLKSNVTELSEHLKALTRERDKTVQYHVQMIDSLKAKNEEAHQSLHGIVENERSLIARSMSESNPST